jgi:hypothetical protein
VHALQDQYELAPLKPARTTQTKARIYNEVAVSASPVEQVGRMDFVEFLTHMSVLMKRNSLVNR